MKSRAVVLKSIQVKIRLLHLAYSTEEAYCGWVGLYYDFCLTLPKAWSPERKAEAFLSHLAVNVGSPPGRKIRRCRRCCSYMTLSWASRWATSMPFEFL